VEWEFAAGMRPSTGGELRKARYPWGNDPPSAVRANLDGFARGCVDVAAHPEGDNALGVRSAFLAMADLMIRPGEARGANVEDYDFRPRELGVRHAMKGLTHEAPRGGTKSRDRRPLAVTARLAEWIDAHVGAEQRLPQCGPAVRQPRGAGGRSALFVLHAG
jgi:hypothetical protein